MPRSRYTLDGKIASARDIRGAATENLLKDYIAGTDVKRNLKIPTADLNRWRKQGQLSAIKWKGRLYYSRKDLASLINI